MTSRLVDELEDLYALRLLVEAEGILRTVPSLPDRQAGRLVELTYEMDRHAGRYDPASLAQADSAFHLGLVAGAGPRVRTLAEELARCTQDRWRTASASAQALEASLREHRQILASALEQDGEECVRRSVEHHVRTVVELVAEIEPGHALDRLRIAALQATGTQITALDAV